MTIASHIASPYLLTVITGNEERQVSITEELMTDAASLLDKMDQDMDRGTQLSRRYISSPGRIERGQVVANRLLTALHTQNDASASLMSAYLLSRLPGIKTACINTEGEADETLFYDHNDAVMQ